MKKLFLSLALIVIGFSTLSQAFHKCNTVIPDSVREQFKWGTSCKYLDKFHVDSIENEKVVRVNFHVVQDENGNNNFTVSDTATLRVV